MLSNSCADKNQHGHKEYVVLAHPHWILLGVHFGTAAGFAVWSTTLF